MMIKRAMEQLAYELNAFPDQDATKHVFLRGLRMQSSFITSRDFWVKFLRATFFQPFGCKTDD